MFIRFIFKTSTKMICRLCLEITTKKFDIFSEKEDPRIAEIITKYFHIEVQPNDVSTIICAECWKYLFDFHRFWLSINEKQEALQIHVICKQIKQDDDVEVKEPVNTPVAYPPIECKSNVLREAEIEIVVEEHSAFADRLDFEAVEMKCDETSINRDSYVDLFSSPVDDHTSEEIVLDLKTTKKRKETKKKITTAKPITKKSLYRTLPQNDIEGVVPKESDSIEQEEKNGKKTLILELDQFIANNTQLSCCLCSQSLTDFKDLKKHFRETHKCVGYIPCCNNRFVKRTEYVDHLKLHKDPDLFKCKLCNKKLASRHNHQNHMYTVHPNRESLLFPCKLCSRRFAKQYILDYHIKSRHTTTKNYVCKTCHKGFKNSQLLNQHERIVHLNAYDSVCEICGKCFSTSQNLLNHMEAIHNKTPLPEEQCKICLKRLKNVRCLNKHMIGHRDQASGQEFKCPQCGAGKNTRHALAAHIRYHHSGNVFTCKMCGKEFKNPRGLKEHESTHTGTYLYTCPFCPKTFRSHGNMHKHKVNTHSQEWKHNRPQPNFVNNSLLNVLPTSEEQSKT